MDDYVTGLDKKSRLRLIAELALGRHSKSPFNEVIPAMKERLDEVVRRLGQDPGRLEDDVPSEIAFRRLLAWGRIVEDADHRFIEDMAGTGVPLGVRGEIPWIEAVYDKKHGSEEAGAIQWA